MFINYIRSEPATSYANWENGIQPDESVHYYKFHHGTLGFISKWAERPKLFFNRKLTEIKYERMYMESNTKGMRMITEIKKIGLSILLGIPIVLGKITNLIIYRLKGEVIKDYRDQFSEWKEKAWVNNHLLIAYYNNFINYCIENRIKAQVCPNIITHFDGGLMGMGLNSPYILEFDGPSSILGYYYDQNCSSTEKTLVLCDLLERCRFTGFKTEDFKRFYKDLEMDGATCTKKHIDKLCFGIYRANITPSTFEAVEALRSEMRK